MPSRFRLNVLTIVYSLAMYRIGCFRDDIIFLIYLYQRWAYRVDPKRVNEYGTSLEHPEGEPEQAAIEPVASDDKQDPETKKDK